MKKKNLITQAENEILTECLGLAELYSGKFSSKERKIVSQYNNLLSVIPGALNVKSPGKRIKTNLMKKIRKNSGKHFDFIFDNDNKEKWKHHSIKGIRYKRLALNEDRGYAMLLLKVEPGTYYPAHKHHGAEECYVIEGDLYAQGKTLGPGDFHHAGAGSSHEPLYTKGGCTVLLVIDPADA